MVEPVINYTNFYKDLDEGMSAYNLQNKYKLTPRQYRWIMRNTIRKSGYSRKASRFSKYKSRTKFHEPYITLKQDGRYIIRKNSKYYGQYDTLEIARQVKQKLVEHKWDKRQLNNIRKELGLKPMRYTYE